MKTDQNSRYRFIILGCIASITFVLAISSWFSLEKISKISSTYERYIFSETDNYLNNNKIDELYAKNVKKAARRYAIASRVIQFIMPTIFGLICFFTFYHCVLLYRNCSMKNEKKNIFLSQNKHER